MLAFQMANIDGPSISMSMEKEGCQKQHEEQCACNQSGIA